MCVCVLYVFFVKSGYLEHCYVACPSIDDSFATLLSFFVEFTVVHSSCNGILEEILDETNRLSQKGRMDVEANASSGDSDAGYQSTGEWSADDESGGSLPSSASVKEAEAQDNAAAVGPVRQPQNIAQPLWRFRWRQRMGSFARTRTGHLHFPYQRLDDFAFFKDNEIIYLGTCAGVLAIYYRKRLCNEKTMRVFEIELGDGRVVMNSCRLFKDDYRDFVDWLKAGNPDIREIRADVEKGQNLAANLKSLGKTTYEAVKSHVGGASTAAAHKGGETVGEESVKIVFSRYKEKEDEEDE